MNLENWRRPFGRYCTIWMKTIQQDLKSDNLSLNEATDIAQKSTLEIDVYIWHYALLVVHDRKEEFAVPGLLP